MSCIYSLETQGDPYGLDIALVKKQKLTILFHISTQ
jgi:hypothetical protein